MPPLIQSSGAMAAYLRADVCAGEFVVDWIQLAMDAGAPVHEVLGYQ